MRFRIGPSHFIVQSIQRHVIPKAISADGYYIIFFEVIFVILVCECIFRVRKADSNLKWPIILDHLRFDHFDFLFSQESIDRVS